MIIYDCHAHVFEKVVAIPEARYVPNAPAPLTDWQHHLAEHGLRGGVIVQVSFLGSDNSELCQALAQLDTTQFAGVAVLEPTASEEEIVHLMQCGVRGVRWNLVRGATIPDFRGTVVRSFLERIYARDMHLELHLESPRLATIIEPLLDLGGKVVVDHLGLPADPDPKQDPWLRAITKIDDLSGLYVKFSGSYRVPFDTRPHASALWKILQPDHVVWGSDWPHTQHETEVSYRDMATVRSESELANDAEAVRALYGLETDSLR